jgi:hypothetical protein
MGDAAAAAGALKGWVQRTIAEMLLMEVGECVVHAHARLGTESQSVSQVIRW